MVTNELLHLGTWSLVLRTPQTRERVTREIFVSQQLQNMARCEICEWIKQVSHAKNLCLKHKNTTIIIIIIIIIITTTTPIDMCIYITRNVHDTEKGFQFCSVFANLKNKNFLPPPPPKNIHTFRVTLKMNSDKSPKHAITLCN
jgi:hypothetical protein